MKTNEISNDRLKAIISNLLWSLEGENMSNFINDRVVDGDITIDELKSIDENLYNYYSKFNKKEVIIKSYDIYEPLENCLDAALFDSGTILAHMLCEIDDYVVDIALTVCGTINIEYKGVNYKSPSKFPEELKKIIKNHVLGIQNMKEFCYVNDSNWFEFLYEVKHENDSYSDGFVLNKDLFKCNKEKLKEEFLIVCENIKYI